MIGPNRCEAPYEVVAMDMLGDLFLDMKKHAAFTYKRQLNRKLNNQGLLAAYDRAVFSPDMGRFLRENPNCGNLALSVEETARPIANIAEQVGRMGIYAVLSEGVYSSSLRVDGERTWPAIRVEDWSGDYALRMAEAAHLGLTHELAEGTGANR